MATIYLADNQVLMCEKCDKHPAQFTTQAPTPNLSYQAICATCCANICLENNDKIGYEKFLAREVTI